MNLEPVFTIMIRMLCCLLSFNQTISALEDVSESETIKRHLLYYDERGILVKVVEDNGITDDPEDFSNVTEQQVIEIPPHRYAQMQEMTNIIKEEEDDYSHQEVPSLMTGEFFNTEDENLLYLAGYYDNVSKEGIIGKGEISNKVRVTFINGIMNREAACLLSAELLSILHGNVNVHYLYHTTPGIPGDILRGFLINFCQWTSPEAYKLAAIWKQMIAEMGGAGAGGQILHYVHSLGAAETRMAGNLMTPEERSMIQVIAFGSPTVLPEGGFVQIIHYVSYRDAIFFMDIIRYLQNAWTSDTSSVVFINSIIGIPFIDHSFRYTYRPVLEELGNRFIATYGHISE